MSGQNYKIRIKLGEAELEAEGDKDFVKKVVADWKKSIEKPPPPAITPTKGRVSPRKEISAKTLKQFYEEKSPSGHQEKIAVFAYYLKSFEEKKEFSKDDINSCYTKARARKPKSISTAISDAASKYEFVERGSERGLWKLTSHGENLIMYDLPRKKE